MTNTQSVSFLSPEEIATREMPDVAYTKLPNLTSIFKDRQSRLEFLAEGHNMRDFLLFMAQIAGAQHRVLNHAEFDFAQVGATSIPSLEHLQTCAQQGLPPLRYDAIFMGRTWIDDFQFILRDVLDCIDIATPATRVLQFLARMSEDDLQKEAQKLLSGNMSELNMGAAPLIAAALQVFWVRLASVSAKLYPSQPFPQIANATLCPCCGSRPVSSMNTLGTDVGTSRYLHCSLCQTQWYMTRIKCTHCESTKGIAYHSLESSPGEAESTAGYEGSGVSVETCDECMHYLKILNMAKNPLVEPVADDLATLALDILISEEGYECGGINLMLFLNTAPQDTSLQTIDFFDPPASGLH